MRADENYGGYMPRVKETNISQLDRIGFIYSCVYTLATTPLAKFINPVKLEVQKFKKNLPNLVLRRRLLSGALALPAAFITFIEAEFGRKDVERFFANNEMLEMQETTTSNDTKNQLVVIKWLEQNDGQAVLKEARDTLESLNSNLIKISQEKDNLNPLNLILSLIFINGAISFASWVAWLIAMYIVFKFEKNNLKIQMRERENLKILKTSQNLAARLEKALKDLTSKQSKLVHAEKMSSLGQLSSGLAHEINNPINFISGNIKHVKDYVHDLLDLLDLFIELLDLVKNNASESKIRDQSGKIRDYMDDIDLDFLRKDLLKALSSMLLLFDWVVNILKSLKDFSRMD